MHRPQPYERYAQLAVAVRPAHGCVRLVILPDRRTQLDAPGRKRGDQGRRVADAILDLYLAHIASAHPRMSTRQPGIGGSSTTTSLSGADMPERAAPTKWRAWPPEVGVPVLGLPLGRIGRNGVHVDVHWGDVLAGREARAVPGGAAYGWSHLGSPRGRAGCVPPRLPGSVAIRKVDLRGRRSAAVGGWPADRRAGARSARPHLRDHAGDVRVAGAVGWGRAKVG